MAYLYDPDDPNSVLIAPEPPVVDGPEVPYGQGPRTPMPVTGVSDAYASLVYTGEDGSEPLPPFMPVTPELADTVRQRMSVLSDPTDEEMATVMDNLPAVAQRGRFLDR
ncbi:MAG TPA: hypothetical protein VEI97_14315, partial [bacterium]|nr:hypothetical protein [bacterium]